MILGQFLNLFEVIVLYAIIIVQITASQEKKQQEIKWENS